MKKYIINVMILFMAQNVCAMEVDLFDRSIEYDDKCKLVAKYLHKYPRGKNEKEAKEIEWFLKDVELEPVTRWLVKKYKNIFDTMDAEVYLHTLYQEKLPVEIREKVFTLALSYSAKEYYVTHNMLSFLDICTPRYYQSCPNFIYPSCKPYFLAEINRDNIHMEILTDSNIGDKLSYEKVEFKAHLTKGSLIRSTLIKKIDYCSEIHCMKKLISFLDAREERVHNFHIMFDNYIKQLSQMNEKDGVNGFIFLLDRFKELTKRTISQHTGREHRLILGESID